tara:strand:- start:50 stop:223 length:174 start_codon:yes stop_codon:yes gene_type:complete
MPVGGSRRQRALASDNGKCGGPSKAGLPPRVGVSIANMLRFRDCSCKLAKGNDKCKK